MRRARRLHNVASGSHMSTDAAQPQPGKPIRVLLVEDHEHVLWGLRKLIEGERPRMEVSATAKSVPQAFAALGERAVDVVVLDVFLAEDNSLAHLRELCASGAAIVVLTGSRDPEIQRRAIQGGVFAVVLKEQPAEVLLHEIERACARQRDCPSAVGAGNAGSVSSTTRR